jgi:phospholipid N-methyltransferase
MDGTRTASAQAAAGTRHPLAMFARNFLRQPLAVGTLLPSSRWVVQRLLQAIDLSEAQQLVEFGPGIGTISAALLERMPASSRLLVIETNAEFVNYLRSRFDDPRLTIAHGSAEQLRTLLAASGARQADRIVSGIPLSTLGAATRRRVLDETQSLLAADGRLLVYQYSSTARRHLEQRFAAVEHALEWRNLLPMHLFFCRHPHAR